MAFVRSRKWHMVEPAYDTGAITLPEIPREYTGLRKDGKRDMRFTKGETYAELQEVMSTAIGVISSDSNNQNNVTSQINTDGKE